MEEWWKRHRGVTMGRYKESDVEDVTGCIPLLLDTCKVGGKIDLTVKDLHEIYDNAAGFAQIVKENNSESKWKWYV